ncbi:ubiquinone/menaquinone biosynthesis methyltransferase [Desulfovermiculus halophilus]|uniref:ubiquinone/menaquinone biosynthesis methyltransferase n=1 Tax=Desulfovermiculus halophilus TaxID=339722 RepID=UPI0004877F2B|nr:ubiquinone/menaquinone biosynthesis methyltransferase [Desulfovermiculus halophilus]
MIPRQSLDPSLQTQTGKAVGDMFGRIAPVYDLLNRCLSLGLDISWRKALVQAAAPPSGGRVLDLAAGTLDVAAMLQASRPRLSVLAADISLPMLMRGRSKNRQGKILPLGADARRLPLPDASVDRVTIAFGLRNIRPRENAYAEIQRVLTPGGRLCILEFGSGGQRILGGLYNLYLTRFLPALGRLISRDRQAYTYLARTICEFPTAPALEAEMRTAGFSWVTGLPLSSGIVWLHTAGV